MKKRLSKSKNWKFAGKNHKWNSGIRYRSKTAFRRQRRRSGWMNR